jgi:hypothetical protein
LANEHGTAALAATFLGFPKQPLVFFVSGIAGDIGGDIAFAIAGDSTALK